MSLDRTRGLRRLIEAMVGFHELPPWLILRPEERNPEDQRFFLAPSTWLEGLIQVESSGDPRAMRYEPHLDRRKPRIIGLSDQDEPGVDDHFEEDDRSYGLTQVLGTNVKWMYKLKGKVNFEFALHPVPNIDIGCRVLSFFLGRAKQEAPRALAMYNAGFRGGDNLPNGQLRNQAYVDKVAARAIEVFKDLRGVL